MMNSEQVASLARTGLQVFGGYLVGRGYVDVATMEAVSGAVLTLVVTGYGLWVRRNAALIAAGRKAATRAA